MMFMGCPYQLLVSSTSSQFNTSSSVKFQFATEVHQTQTKKPNLGLLTQIRGETLSFMCNKMYYAVLVWNFIR